MKTSTSTQSPVAHASGKRAGLLTAVAAATAIGTGVGATPAGANPTAVQSAKNTTSVSAVDSKTAPKPRTDANRCWTRWVNQPLNVTEGHVEFIRTYDRFCGPLVVNGKLANTAIKSPTGTVQQTAFHIPKTGGGVVKFDVFTSGKTYSVRDSRTGKTTVYNGNRRSFTKSARVGQSVATLVLDYDKGRGTLSATPQCRISGKTSKCVSPLPWTTIPVGTDSVKAKATTGNQFVSREHDINSAVSEGYQEHSVTLAIRPEGGTGPVTLMEFSTIQDTSSINSKAGAYTTKCLAVSKGSPFDVEAYGGDVEASLRQRGSSNGKDFLTGVTPWYLSNGNGIPKASQFAMSTPCLDA